MIAAAAFGMLGVTPHTFAQTASLVPVRKPSTQNTTIGQDTSWTFRMKPDVIVESPIVRLSDVIVPLDPNTPGWPRLARTAVGLVPVDGTPMQVDRDRLSKVIEHTEATPRTIHWVGSNRSQVHYEQGNPSRSQAVQQTQYRVAVDADTPAIDLAFAERIIRWIKQTIDRDDRDFQDRYELTIDPTQPAMHGLVRARGIQQATFVSGIQEGEVVLRVVSLGLEGPIEAELVATIVANPVAIVPTRSIRSGVRLGPGDLTKQPIPLAEWDDAYYTDVSDLIGTESKGSLRASEPIRYGSVGKPTLVRRGDLLEVRVINGAISVTTNAKAQCDGSESDLIEIETLDPRKRLVARVVSSGLVEIVTRAPRTE
ncbi:flagellar basal body P-ring biosynthesis protein FlgA [Novipirellula artificiosorum]|uniref:Flagellar basal body P-ring biosynthesis protein FlgA n=2 Tax=Novipirellula artificiosorum TaxID=2528016 RepID=A0A5C6DE52_9BACT|nr:flagellar basal body P-ring biosynthesis protein FlgA [Novipirellula artificiosorum]